MTYPAHGRSLRTTHRPHSGQGLGLRPLLAGLFLVATALGSGCASSADSRDPLQEELERLKREQEQQGGKTQCRPGKQAQCYSGDPNLAGRGACKYGLQTCMDNNRWGACKEEGRPLPQELCNSVDDDCNGVIDDGFARAGTPCSTGMGACISKGKWACQPDGSDAFCDAPAVQPREEICDSIDNDCDGEVDEKDTQGNGDYCSTGRKGPCRRGHKVCVAGGFQCISDHEAGQEICNQKDDDCDGEVDEQCITYQEWMELKRDQKNQSRPR